MPQYSLNHQQVSILSTNVLKRKIQILRFRMSPFPIIYIYFTYLIYYCYSILNFVEVKDLPQGNKYSCQEQYFAENGSSTYFLYSISRTPEICRNQMRKRTINRVIYFFTSLSMLICSHIFYGTYMFSYILWYIC